MVTYKLIDFALQGESCTARFKVKLGDDGKPFEATVTGPVGDSGPAFLKAAGTTLLKRYLPPSKFEGDLRTAIAEGHVYEALDPAKEPTLLVDDTEGEETAGGGEEGK